MKIYTRSGDGGETNLLHGVRVWKNSPRLEVCGTLDELNAMLGLVRAEKLPDDMDRLLGGLQNDLFNMGTELATVAPATPPCPTISAKQVQAIEEAIDRYDAGLQPLKGFILPGGIRCAALLHVSRTICRRAERHLIALMQVENKAVSGNMLAYINRLSDFLYVLARTCNANASVMEEPWSRNK